MMIIEDLQNKVLMYQKIKISLLSSINHKLSFKRTITLNKLRNPIKAPNKI